MSRQCGSRVGGGLYACVPCEPGGRPVEDFLLCPPVKIDKEALGLSAIGVKLIARHDKERACQHCKGSGEVAIDWPTTIYDRDTGEEQGKRETEACARCKGTGKFTVWHIFDIVGAEYYPNVSDFVEETRWIGVSRRCELDASQYKLITKNSRLILLHPKAYLNNAGHFYEQMRLTGESFQTAEGQFFKCPQHRADHTINSMAGLGYWEMCAGLWLHDLEVETRVPQTVWPNDPRRCRRHLECGNEYQGYVRSETVEPKHELAIFASFPLHHFEHVDPEGKHEAKRERLAECEVPLEVQPE